MKLPVLGKRILVAGLALSTSLAIAGCAADEVASNSDSKELTKVSMGYFNGAIIGQLTVLAKDKGFFKEEGLDVELVPVSTGPALASMLVGKTADFSDVVVSIGFPLIKQGQKIVFLTANRSLDYNIIAGKNVSLPNKDKPFPGQVVDLKGKNIGITGRGAATESFARRVLEAGGLSSKDVTFVPVGGAATAIPALNSGKIDFLVSFAPEEQLLGAGNFQMVVDQVGGKTGDLFKDFMLDGYATTQEFIDKNPKAVKSFCTAMWKAQKFAQDEKNLAAVAESVSTTQKLDLPVAEAVWKTYKGTFDLTLTEEKWKAQGAFGEGDAAGYVPSFADHVYEPCASN